MMEAGVQKVETVDACREIRDFLSEGIYQVMGSCKYVSLLPEPQEQHPRRHDTDPCVLWVCGLRMCAHSEGMATHQSFPH